MHSAPRKQVSAYLRTWSSKLVSLMFPVLLFAAGCSSVPGTAASPGTSTVAATEADEAQRLLVKRGRTQFLHCNSCHAVDAAAPPPFGGSLGPHLEDIVGRASASVEGFEYTDEMLALDLIWDEETLDQWLEQPQAVVPAMCEPFTGLPRPEHRKALIAYLKNPGNR